MTHEITGRQVLVWLVGFFAIVMAVNTIFIVVSLKTFRGEDEQKVRHWLETAARVPGYCGFAVGRSTFSQPLVEWNEGKLTRDAAIAEMARRFKHWVDVFEQAQAA